MKTKYLSLFTFFLFFVFIINACSPSVFEQDNKEEPQLKDLTKTIQNFELKQSLNPEFTADIVSEMTDMNILITVPYGTVITALKPTITFLGKEVNPASEVVQDFSNPVAYTVTAEDGSTSIYTVQVIVSPSTSKDITSFTIKAADNPSIGTSDIEAVITPLTLLLRCLLEVI